MTRENQPGLEEALEKFGCGLDLKAESDLKFGGDLLDDPIGLWVAFSQYRGVRSADLLMAKLRPIIDQWLDYRQLQSERTVAGKRGRPLKPWRKFLLERLAVERVNARKSELMRGGAVNSVIALELATKEIAKVGKPHVAASTLSEWVSHPTRLHRRKRNQHPSKNHF